MKIGALIWGLVLIALGVLFLAAAQNWIEWSFALSLLQLWPLLLIMIGIGLLLEDRSPGLAAILIVVVFAGGIGLAVGTAQGGWRGWGSPQLTAIEGPQDTGFKTGRADIEVGGMALTVTGRESGQTVKGSVRTNRTPTVEQGSDPATGGYRLRLSQADSARVFLPFVNAKETLSLDLSPDLTWDLQVKTGATSAHLDLSQVQLQRLSVKSGASSLDLTIGPRVAPTGAEVAVEGGVGSYVIRLPRTLDITLTSETGVSSVNVDPGFSRNGDTYTLNGGGAPLEVRVKSGVSSVDVQLY